MIDISNKIEVCNISDVGQKRPHNEDSTLTDEKRGLLILADGMGGYKAGEVASAMAVTDIYKELLEGIKLNKNKGLEHPEQAISGAIKTANRHVITTAQEDKQCEGMGTTIIAGYLHNNKFTIGHVGDSRVYSFKNNELKQITRDHSLIEELIERGIYSREEAEQNTPKNLVTRALGIEGEIMVDITEIPVETNDIFLLCSDGLNDMVEDEEIHLTLSKYSANLLQTTEELVRLANVNGGKDNISVILVRIRDELTETVQFVDKIKSMIFKKSGDNK